MTPPVPVLTIVAAALLALAPWTTACAETIGEILADPARFDDAPVSVRGVIRNLRTHVNKRGVAYYTFDLADDWTSPALLVIAFGRPACKPPAFVKVDGRFHRGPRYIDATAIACEAD